MITQAFNVWADVSCKGSLMVRMFKTILLAYALGVAFVATTANSHSGGLNSQGCHGGSRPYHCHRSSSEMVPSSSGGSRLRCSAGSRSKDCRGAVSSRYDTSSVIKVQYLLAKHCGLQPSFIDGAWGQQSQRILKRFQTAYDLSPDGIIGNKTIRALNGSVNGRCR